MSIDLLVGRTLRNNLFNLGIEKNKSSWAKTIFSEIYNMEPGQA